jgi:hypothetical protein
MLLYADKNLPLPVVENLRQLGYDGLTAQEDGRQAMPDPAVLPPGTQNTFYGQVVSASGGTAPLSFSLAAGALPTGLSLNPTSGVISGTPSTPGLFSFTITAMDAASATGSQAYTVTITPQGPPCSTDGFVPLFNGKELTGWKAPPSGTGTCRRRASAAVVSGRVPSEVS